MAAWQFQFSLLPVAGILRLHGKVVTTLPEYDMRNPDAPIKELSDFNNYWEGIRMPSPWIESLERLLPQKKSWSDEAKMFGDDESDNIEVWNDDINCSIDVRNLNMPLVISIVQIANHMQCKIILKDGGLLIDPDIFKVTSELKNSRAMRLVTDPIGFLKQQST